MSPKSEADARLRFTNVPNTGRAPAARPGREPIAPRDIELARVAKALGHPARVAILRYLAACGDCMCGDIVNHLPLAQATVSQHLKVLKEAGLIRGSIDPPRVCYCVDPRGLARARTLFSTL